MNARTIFQKTWFLGFLLIMCVVGYLGHRWVEKLINVYSPKIHIFLLMLCMSFSLRADQLRRGIASYKLHLLMFLINYIIAVGVGIIIALLFFRQYQGLFIGILIVAAVPTTMASAAVWARLANGNDGISISFSFISNMLGVVVTPTLLAAALFLTGITVTAEDGSQVELFARFPFVETLNSLAITVIIPVVVGQALRLLIPKIAEKSRNAVSIIAQVLVLLMIFIAVGKAQPGLAGLSGGMLVLILVFAPVFHIILLIVCFAFGKFFRLSRDEFPPFVFSGSQKTLPLGYLIAADIFGMFPLATIGIIVYHPTQLVIDLFIVELFNRKGKKKV